MTKNKSGLSIALLLIGVMFWGFSFAFVKESMASIDVYSFLFARFSLAAVALAIIFARRLRNVNAAVLRKSLGIGGVLGVSFIFQTMSMKFTTASNAAIITGLCAVIVPVYVTVADRKLPPMSQLAAVVLAIIGLALLALKLPFEFNPGDVWALLCALGFGLHIVLVGRLVRGVDALAFSVVQAAVVAVMCAAAGFVFRGGIEIPRSPAMWRVLVFLAVFATAYIYTIQARFQRYISEIRATMVYSLEPLFASVFAFFYLGERLPARGILGGALILAAMFIADAQQRNNKKV